MRVEGLSQYGPWAIAFGLLLVTGKELIVTLISNGRRDNREAPLAELAKAVDKLSAVLERIEKTQDKALTEIQATQREMLMLLSEIRMHRGG